MAELDVKERQAGDVTILDLAAQFESVKVALRCAMRSEGSQVRARRSCF